MQEEKATSNATTKLIAILALVTSVAITSTVVILTESQTAAAQGKSIGKGHDLGQCYKTQNKLLQDAGLKGKEKSGERKALCEYDPG
jgi:hypothetical protein